MSGITAGRTTQPLRLFISHSSKDKAYVELLIALLRSALNLPAEQIRCTSVDGYRLRVGANTNDQLRIEIQEAESFIGVISEHSLRSSFVMFELGARWGVRKHLSPLLAPGATPNLLGAPLSGLNALDGAEPAQLHQLVDDVAQQLGINPSNPASFHTHLQAIVRAAGSPTSALADQEPTAWDTKEKTPVIPPGLTAEAESLVLGAAEDPHGYVLRIETNLGTIIQANQRVLNEPANPRSVATWERALRQVCKLGLLEGGSGEAFKITDEGYHVADALREQRQGLQT